MLMYTSASVKTTLNFGLAYDVVTSICYCLQYQGYRVYYDNFFSLILLSNHLLAKGFLSCSTCIYNRRGFPEILKDKDWGKAASHGDMRYVQDGYLLCHSNGKIGWFIHVCKVGLFMYALRSNPQWDYMSHMLVKFVVKIYTCFMELLCNLYTVPANMRHWQCWATIIEDEPTLGQRLVFAGVDLYKNILDIKIYSSPLIPYVYPL